MEKILQNIVKIIIVGIICSGNIFCSRTFLPPLPYYQNDPYYVPAFINPYQDYVPVYIQPNIPPPPPPISFHNTNAYTRHLPPPKTYQTPQLFYKDENYHPLPPPGVNYPITPFSSHPHNYKPPFMEQQKANYDISKTPNLQETKPPTEQKVHTYSSNIILKDETYPPYYQDEYNKNYNEDDYTDNYTDDAPVQKEPCEVNAPFRNFEPGPVPKLANGADGYTLCNPYFQPNFGNSVYAVKAPITLLPSRFPPRVEEFVQRIQNYFSTYTEKETPKPDTQNTTIVPAVNETSTETLPQGEDVIQTNATDIQQLEQSPLINQLNETDKVTIELEFVGKKTPTDVTASTKGEEVLTTTEEYQNTQENTPKSQAELVESSVPEVSTLAATVTTAEHKTEMPDVTSTPTDEVLQEATDTNS